MLDTTGSHAGGTELRAGNRRFAHSWFLPGVDLWFPGLDKKKEADIFGIADAKIISGEVKATGTDFAKNNEVRDDIATRLKADPYVMAAPTAIPADAQAEATQLCQDNALELIVLEPKDLRT